MYMGSTIVACRYESGIIVGCDSQINNDDEDIEDIAYCLKHVELAPTVYVTCSGHDDLVEGIIAEMRPLTRRIKALKNLAGRCHIILKEKLERLKLLENVNRTASFMFSSWLPEEGCELFKVTPTICESVRDVAAIGSGAAYLEHHLQDWRANMEEMVANFYVYKGVKLGATLDAYSGGEILLIQFNMEGNLKKRRWEPADSQKPTREYHLATHAGF